MPAKGRQEKSLVALLPGRSRQSNRGLMPELPEVETVVRGLRPVLEGRRIARVDLRRNGLRLPFPRDFAARLKGRRIDTLSRRGKYILAYLDVADVLLVHLGMTGRFTICDPAGGHRNLGEFYHEAAAEEGGQGRHDHVVFTLEGGRRLVYTDPRRFGVMDLAAEAHLSEHPLLKEMGLEPLGNVFSAEVLAGLFASKAAPLKSALLDQHLVAGLGNIYVCEALYRTGLSPRRRAGTLVRRDASPDPRLDQLVRHIRDVLNEAIAAGGSTLRDFAQADGAPGHFQQRFSVYDREDEPCPRCRRPIKRIVQAGRSTFYCSNCQK